MRLTGIVWDLVVPVLLIAVLVSPVRAVERRTFTFSMIENYMNGKVAQAILEKAYAKLGIKAQFLPFPAARALSEANAGTTDGAAERIYSVGETHKNLVRVEPHMFFLEGRAYVRGEPISMEDPNILRHYRVGALLGIVYAHEVIKQYELNAVRATSIPKLLELLENKRLDVIIMDRYTMEKVLQENGEVGIRACEPPLVRKKLYHYLHKKNAALAPAISRVLTEMKESGEIDRIIDQVITGR
mgnify:FL=1